MANIGGLRSAYNNRDNVFLESDIEVKEPFDLFERWFNDAKSHPDIGEPNGVCLATATKDGIPSARFVLLKGYDTNGFTFFTHYTSRKGTELESNPNAAMAFWWEPLSRSVRIEGTVEKLSQADADNYFYSRPFGSQIAAVCSKQSTKIEGRNVLVNREKELRQQYKDKVPRPESWGGYILKPNSIEFWHGQTDRMHDRIKFRKPVGPNEPDGKFTYQGVDGWIYERLSP